MVTTKRPKLEPLVDRVASVSTIPEVALQVVKVTNDPSAGARELQVAVESDPALMVRCLRSVNSAANGIRNKVTSIRQAISLLGFRRIRDITLTNAVADVFKEECTIGPYRRVGLWSHMVATATCAEIVTRTSGASGCEDAYAAGLLHDFGIIAEDQYARNVFPALIADLTDSEELTTQEHEHLGFDHTVLGLRLAEKWDFPETMRAAIRFHHMPQNYRGDHHSIVNVVAAANWIVSDCRFPSIGINIVTRPDSAFDALNLDLEKSDAIAAAFLQCVSDGALMLFNPDA